MKIILYLMLFASCCVVGYEIVKELIVDKILQKSIVTYADNSSKLRRKREEQLRIEEGEQDKTSLMYSIDLLIEQSGLKKYLPFINTELYILIAGTASVLGFTAGCMICGFFAGFLCILSVMFLSYALPVILAGRNFKNTEKDILQFVNLVGSYSATSNNIITIFGNMYLFLNEPLKSSVKMCYDEAQMTGDISSALIHLERRINHPMFRMTIRNIEIASRHEANYSQVIGAIREIIREYIRNQEEVKAMIASARAQLLLLAAAGAVIIYMVNGLLDGVNLFALLTTTLLGQIILGGLIAVVFICIYVFMSFGKQRG